MTAIGSTWNWTDHPNFDWTPFIRANPDFSWIKTEVEAMRSVVTATGVAPNTGARSEVVSVTITGTGFEAAPIVSVSGTGVAVSSVVRASATSITATFTVAANASLTNRSVVVTNADGGAATIAAAFNVTTPAP